MTLPTDYVYPINLKYVFGGETPDIELMMTFLEGDSQALIVYRGSQRIVLFNNYEECDNRTQLLKKYIIDNPAPLVNYGYDTIIIYMLPTDGYKIIAKRDGSKYTITVWASRAFRDSVEEKPEIVNTSGYCVIS